MNKVRGSLLKSIVSFTLAIALVMGTMPVDRAVMAAQRGNPGKGSETGADTAMAETDGFSLYTVEFTYDNKQYVLPGDSEMELSKILSAVGLSGDAKEVLVSDSSLFSAEKNDNGEWIVTTHTAFDSREWMKVTIDGVEYELAVTDNQVMQLSQAVLINSSNKSSYDGKTVSGTIPADSSAGQNGDFISEGAIVVDGIELHLTIENFCVDYSERYDVLSGISLVNNATLHLTVKGENTLKGGFGGAGIAVPEGCSLEITSASTGTLHAIGGDDRGGGAGIGANGNNHRMRQVHSGVVPQGCGSIIINGGTIEAQGGSWRADLFTKAGGGAGIGGTEYAGCNGGYDNIDNDTYTRRITGSVSINGGTVIAQGGTGATGIGGGTCGTIETISISGGNITATGGGNGGAAIGTGFNSSIISGVTLSSPAIIISNGMVTAKGNIGYGSKDRDAAFSGGSVTIYDEATVSCSGTIAPLSGTSNVRTFSATIYDAALTGSIDDVKVELPCGKVIYTKLQVDKRGIGKVDVSVRYTDSQLSSSGTVKVIAGSKTWASESVTLSEEINKVVLGGYLYELSGRIYDKRIGSANHEAVAELGNSGLTVFTYTVESDGADSTLGTATFDGYVILDSEITSAVTFAATDSGSNTYAKEVTFPTPDAHKSRVNIVITDSTIPSAEIVYVGADGNVVRETATRVTADVTQLGDGVWYVDTDTTVSSRMSVEGMVRLVLCDGATLTAPKGITVGSGKSLEIFGQTEDTGRLVINDTEDYNAGIGEGKVEPHVGSGCGTVAVYGANVSAKGGDDAAGIGSSLYSDGGTITIAGGTVTATGGILATGIGGGEGEDGGNITITGGTVNARGGVHAAGIGGGGSNRSGDKGNAGTIRITGGQITAIGGGVHDTTSGGKGGNGIGPGGAQDSNRIAATGGTVDLSWNHGSDRIYASSYGGTVTLSKDFLLQDTDEPATADNIGGKTIVPALTVSFLSNGGTGTMPEVKRAAGEVYTLPENGFGVPSGKVFTGWLIGTDVYAVGDSITVNEDTTVQAKWEMIPAVKPAITTQPMNLTLQNGTVSGNVLTVAAETVDGHTLSYQWYSNTRKSTDGTPISGATESSYAVPTNRDGTTFYYCVVTATRGDNSQKAELTSAVTTVKIWSKLAQELSFSEATQTKACDDADFTVTALHSAGDGVVSYAVTEGNEVATVDSSTGRVHILKVGTATITATAAETEEYAKATAQYTLTVTKIRAKVTTCPVGIDNLKYTGESLALVTAGEADTAMEYAFGTDAATAPEAGWGAELPSKTDAGRYYVWYRAKADGNHEASEPGVLTVKIAKADIRISNTPIANEITYGQTLNDSRLDGGEAIANGLQVTGSFAWSDSSIAPAVADSNKTEYTVIFTPHDGNLNTSTCKVKLTVNKAEIRAGEITVPTATPNLAYTGQMLSLITAGSVSGNMGTMQYAPGTNEGPAPITGWSETIPAAANAGTYYIWYRIIGDKNHKDKGIETPIVVTVAKADHQTENATGFAKYGESNSADIGDLIAAGGAIDGNSITTNDATNILAAAPTYDASSKKVIFTFKEDAAVGSTADIILPVKSGNYKDYNIVITVTVTEKSALALSLTQPDWTYGETAKKPVLTGNAGNGAVTYAYKKKGDTDDQYTADVPKNAGEYIVRATVAETDAYMGGEAYATFTIKTAGGGNTGGGAIGGGTIGGGSTGESGSAGEADSQPVVVTNPDGSTTTTTVTTDDNGSKVEIAVTKTTDGSVIEETTVSKENGDSTYEKIETTADGDTTTTKTEVVHNGKTTTTTTSVEKQNGSGYIEVAVQKDNGASTTEKVTFGKNGKVFAIVETETTKTGVQTTMEYTVKKKNEITLKDLAVDFQSTDEKARKGAAKAVVKLVIPETIKAADGNTYKVVGIDKNAGKNSNLKELVIGNTVKTIAKGAFENCKKLSKITIGKNVTRIEKNAFKGIAKNATIYIRGNKKQRESIKKLLIASGIDKSVKIKKAK
ncbi:MAG: hypothetical protein E7280_03910 [Lachnospiraceae bacterium]|nr:hypothetical protein [Lachnospiraceae bacterium]